MNPIPYDIPTDNMFRPIVRAWSSRIDAAVRHRAPWQRVVDEIMLFYSNSAAAMFDQGTQAKFWPGKIQPRFRVNINLAYEYVRVMVPELLWDYPHRRVSPKSIEEVRPEMFAGHEEMYEQIMQEQQSMRSSAQLHSTMMQTWLNYCGREIPGGGLEGQSTLSVLDALLKGRGVKCIRPYQFPGSGRMITGSFREPPERILIDPDAKTLDGITWMAVQHVDPHYEVERRFQLPDGSLKNRSSLESSWSAAEAMGRYVPQQHQVDGTSNDLVVWYECYSKCGVGTRRTELYEPVKRHLEETVGDFAYLAIAPAVPWPLNAPIDRVIKGNAPTEEVRRMFEWPIPTFIRDDKYPIELLDFYPNTDIRTSACSTWPIPPLAPALGEIKILNYIVPFLVNRVWTSSRDFWAVAGPYKEQLQKEIEKSEDQAFIGIPAVVDDIRKILTIIQQPESRRDMWELIGLIETLFRKRTGMALTAYGMNEDGTQNRSAEETVAKHRAVNVTPEFMQKKIVVFESRCAASEAATARYLIGGEQVRGLLGPTLAMVWDHMVASQDADEVASQLDYTVDAASIRRPNRERDIGNFQAVIQVWLPIMQGYAQQTGNYQSINAIIRLWGEYHDQDVTDLLIPDQSEQMDEMQQRQQELAEQQMQLEMAKLQMEGQKLQADAEGKQVDAQAKIMDAQIKQGQSMAELQQKTAMGEMDAMGKAQDLAFQQQMGQQEMEVKSGMGLIDILIGREKLAQMKQRKK